MIKTKRTPLYCLLALGILLALAVTVGLTPAFTRVSEQEEHYYIDTTKNNEKVLGSAGNAFTMTKGSLNTPIYGALTITVTDRAGNMLEVHVTLNAEHTYVLDKRQESDCVTRGYENYTCSVCGKATKHVDLGYGEHSYGDPTFTWADDGPCKRKAK